MLTYISGLKLRSQLILTETSGQWLIQGGHNGMPSPLSRIRAKKEENERKGKKERE